MVETTPGVPGAGPNVTSDSSSKPASPTVTSDASSTTPSPPTGETGVPESTTPLTTPAGATTTATATATGISGSSTTNLSYTTSSTTAESSHSTNIGPSVTASSTTHQKPTTTSSPNNKDVSTGALAGSIVGAFLGGCLLAFLLAFLYFRKRKQKRDTVASSQDSYLSSSNPKSQSGSLVHRQYESAASCKANDATKLPVAVGTTIPSRYLPPPADDGMVAMKTQTLFDQIALHVENFYVRLPSNPSFQSDTAADITQYDSSLAPTSLLSLLSNSKTQRAGLTHALAFNILEAIRPGSETNTLLPACFRWGPEQLVRGVSDPDLDNAIFNWRMSISHLNARSSDLLNRNPSAITSLAQNFTSKFSPYKNPEFSGSDAVTHLTSVVKAASDYGSWLFAQPCLFEFHWKARNADFTHDQIIIFPMVVKTCDEHGRRLEIPQTIVEAQVMQI